MGIKRNVLMRASYSGITSDFQSDDGGSIPSARSKVKLWEERRIARYKTSGCALCWHYCKHEERFLP